MGRAIEAVVGEQRQHTPGKRPARLAGCGAAKGSVCAAGSDTEPGSIEYIQCGTNQQQRQHPRVVAKFIFLLP